MLPEKKPLGYLKVDIFWKEKHTEVIEPYYSDDDRLEARVRLMGKSIEILKRWNQEGFRDDNGKK